MFYRLQDQEEEPIVYTADRRLYVNQDRSRLVEESDPDAYFLLVAEGGGLSDAVARQYGLIEDPKPKEKEPTAAEDESEAKAVKRPTEDKAVRGPAETK